MFAFVKAREQFPLIALSKNVAHQDVAKVTHATSSKKAVESENKSKTDYQKSAVPAREPSELPKGKYGIYCTVSSWVWTAEIISDEWFALEQ